MAQSWLRLAEGTNEGLVVLYARCRGKFHPRAGAIAPQPGERADDEVFALRAPVRMIVLNMEYSLRVLLRNLAAPGYG